MKTMKATAAAREMKTRKSTKTKKAVANRSGSKMVKAKKSTKTENAVANRSGIKKVKPMKAMKTMHAFAFRPHSGTVTAAQLAETRRLMELMMGSPAPLWHKDLVCNPSAPYVPSAV